MITSEEREEREVRIRVLCELASAASAAQNQRALSVVMPQLKAALTEYIRESAAEEIPRAFQSKGKAA
jgi:hypothetical protein